MDLITCISSLLIYKTNAALFAGTRLFLPNVALELEKPNQYKVQLESILHFNQPEKYLPHLRVHVTFQYASPHRLIKDDFKSYLSRHIKSLLVCSIYFQKFYFQNEDDKVLNKELLEIRMKLKTRNDVK